MPEIAARDESIGAEYLTPSILRASRLLKQRLNANDGTAQQVQHQQKLRLAALARMGTLSLPTWRGLESRPMRAGLRDCSA